MPKTDPRVDAYIAKSADFSKPILKRLRKIVHAGCPDVEELRDQVIAKLTAESCPLMADS